MFVHRDLRVEVDEKLIKMWAWERPTFWGIPVDNASVAPVCFAYGLLVSVPLRVRQFATAYPVICKLEHRGCNPLPLVFRPHHRQVAEVRLGLGRQ